ncbi:Aspartic proteinase [Thalictrum thalictroides]|uniref:Aspartic proteinase n=1 Tax=Thalictrum thalictroides TaxID=46969 RepID=A0A7J6WKZ9_THATH|nr:Aspartic proteinase [Thalictrum thalictroides]
MATTLSSSLSFLTFLVSLIFISSSYAFVQAETSNSTGFSTKLIHMDSVRSPFYNPNLTRTDRIQASVRRSYARLHHIQAMLSNEVFPNDFTSLILPERGEYMMEYYIGTPPVRSYGLIDTGNQPTICRYIVNIHLTARKDEVSLVIQFTVNASMNFIMPMGLIQKGSLPMKLYVFCDVSRKIRTYTLFRGLVGCGDYNHDEVFVTNTPPGIIGLSKSGLSFAGQLKSPFGFAYCLGEPNDPKEDGYIKFGRGVTSINRTWIEMKNVRRSSHYVVDLDGISIGKK